MRPLQISITVTDPTNDEILIVSGSLDILKDLLSGVKISLPRQNGAFDSYLVDQFIQDSNAKIDPLDPKCRTQAQHLYDRYAEWCTENGHIPMPIIRLAREWERLGFTKQHTASSRYWVGIRI